jgi:hypothetical protein
MKRLIIVLLLVTFSGFAQDKEYSKMDKDELIKLIKSKEEEIKKSIKVAKENNSKNNSVDLQKELVSIKQIIKETNNVFLKEIFTNKYIDNVKYFRETDLSFEDDTKKFENSNVLINNILIDDFSTKEEKIVCNKALYFNKNYLKLFEIRKTVLNVKFNKENVEKAVLEIENLPLLEIGSKLEESKNRINNALKKYNENTCLLKVSLDKYKKADQKSPALKQVYISLEKDVNYKEYPYLIEVIRKIKNNHIDYTDDDLHPCEEVKEKSIESIEEKKSSEEKDSIKNREQENKR